MNQEEMLVKSKRTRVLGFEGRSAGVCECEVIIAIFLIVSLSGWAGVLFQLPDYRMSQCETSAIASFQLFDEKRALAALNSREW